MKQAKPILMVLITILICCSYSIGQSSSGIGIKGNVGAVPLGIINNGANVYPIGEYGASVYPVGEYGSNVYPVGEYGSNVYLVGGYGADVYPVGTVNNGAKISLPLREFQCNLISSCGIYNAAKVSSGAIVNLAGVRSGATVSLGGVKSQKP
jgi:hypothetical protein